MKAKIPPLLFLAVIMLAAGCATEAPPKPYDPFLIPKSSIRETIKTVAVVPPLRDMYGVEEKFGRLITAKLRAAGFTVIDVDQTKPIVEKERHVVGGFYDPETGRQDKAKVDLYWQAVVGELKTNFNADALISYAVMPRQINYHKKSAWDGKVRWDGVSESLFLEDGIPEKLFENNINSYGTVRALSLRVILANLARRDLFLNYGGIQLLAKSQSPGLAATGFVPVPTGKLFADPVLMQNAVNVALNPLVK